ncbi:MAG: 3-keto-disaccharide hydrolase [Gemmatimonadales bacterium]
MTLVTRIAWAAVAAGCATHAGPAPLDPPPLTPAERAVGFRPLFDGRTTAGWRGFRMDSMPVGWQVVDGALTRVGPGGDIITRDRFRDFELVLEWKVAPGGNSGIFYRASEDDEEIYWTAPEMQVLDDAEHPDGQSRLTAAGANYGLDPAPAGVVRPAGEWNQVRLVVNGAHVEHWLNGTKVVEYELGSPAWEAKVQASKFAPHPHYGRNAEGYLGLQDHGDRVAYRNIKIRVLP